MSQEDLERQLAQALEKIHELEQELAETNRGLVAMAMELEQRVEQRTEALRKVVEELARSNKDLEQFAYVASHDLQEPLRQVRAFVQILRDRHLGKLEGDAERYMEFVYEGAVRMSNLVRGLLEYSRVGAKDTGKRPISCQEALEAALANLQASIAEARAVVTHDDLPTVLAEPLQLTQLFQNLIGNAIKFRRDGVAPIIHVKCCRDGRQWLFTVKDNGIGIAPEFREKVFMIFQRLHGREKYPGTGIGLAICKKIVEQHGGKVWIESQVNEGSTFYFTLPEERA
jgi:light-regulated signal transduction histidine kinase (bacteriophytochrome)